MKRISVYPAITNEADAADLLSRLNWHLSPYISQIASLSIVSSVPLSMLRQLSAPYYLDPASAPSNAPDTFFQKLEIRAHFDFQTTSWTEHLKQSDIVIVWKIPGEHDETGPDEVFSSQPELRAALPEKIKLVLADRTARATEASLLLSAALGLVGDISQVIADSHAKFLAFTETITRDKCHVFGTGPSLSQVDGMDFSDGDVITCNSFVANEELMAKLNPKVICAADPIFHAGPSSYAAAFREELVKRMHEYDFTLFVPMRDYFVHLHYIPHAFHHRVIALPYEKGEFNLDLKKDFHVAPLPNVLTLLMMPVGASCYDKMTISGCDGRPLHEDQYFWGHHKGSQFNDKMADIKVAHPGFFNISYNDYYSKHCDQVEEMCRKYEARGGEVTGATASFVPALRRRGAAEPLRQPRYAERDAPVTVLSLNPDLVDKIGHYWNYEAKLAPIIQDRGCEYRVAANSQLGSDMISEIADDGTVTIDGITVDPCLSTNSWTLANRIGNRTDKFEDVEAAVHAEFERAIDRVRAAAPGEVIVYMYTGSLEHLNILYQISRDRPDIRIVVNFFWLKTADVWSPRFASKYAWLLEELQHDRRIFATAMTPHQMRALQARTGHVVPVAPHPSPLINDDQARATIATPAPEQVDQVRIFFPSANRVEKGSELLFDTASKLASMLRGENYRVVFRTDPLDENATEEQREALGDYKVLAGHIEEADFIEVLRTADVVVLPYLPPDFADRTSGLLIDALYAGTPVVALGGTWLAECATEHGFGRVVNIPEGEHIARAVYDTILQVKRGEIDMTQAAKSYFASNSWVGLGEQILSGTQSDNQVYWSEPQQEYAETLRESALPLIGQAPPSADARLDAIALARSLMSDNTTKQLVLSGIDKAQALIEAAEDNCTGTALESDPMAYGAVIDAVAKLPEGAWKLEDVRPGAGMSGERNHRREVYTLVETLDHIPPESNVGLIIRDYMPGMADTVPSWIEYTRPAISCLGILTDSYDRPAEKTLELVNWFTQRGYQVLVAEYWHPRRVGDTKPLRRITLAPYCPSRPSTDCMLIALAEPRPVPELKAALNAACTHVEYREVRSSEAIAARLWAQAEPAEKASLLASAATPGGKVWELAGLAAGEIEPDQFTTIKETDELRVHRAFLKFKPSVGEPVCAELDVKATGQRYVSIWLTDRKNKMLAEATFDLEMGKAVKAGTNSTLIDGEAFGGIAALEETASGPGRYHVWLSVDQINTDQALMAQLVMRETAGGTARYTGDSEHVLGVRNFAVRQSNRPAILNDVLTAAAPSTRKEARPAKAPKEAEKVTKVSEANSATQAVRKHARDRIGRIGLFFDRGASALRSEPSRGPAEPIDLVSLGISADPKRGWCVGDKVQVKNGKHGYEIDRNDGSHKDQFFTIVSVERGAEYELALTINEIDPRLVVLVDGQVAVDMSEARDVSVKVTAKTNTMRIDLKGVDSYRAKFTLADARLTELARALKTA
ncbi:MAG: glycosyltransferase [Hyphomonadaceae bacterium]|nr:glycosyltransferase [Hyphomonadaceae bacterium]